MIQIHDSTTVARMPLLLPLGSISRLRADGTERCACGRPGMQARASDGRVIVLCHRCLARGKGKDS
jgi:hypothetical protein